MTLASPRRIARRRSLTTRAASCTKRAPLAHRKPKTRAARTVTRPALSRRDLRKLARNAGRRVASLAYDDTTANDRRSSGRAPRPRARFDPALEAAKPQWDRKGGQGHIDVRQRADGGVHRRVGDGRVVLFTARRVRRERSRGAVDLEWEIASAVRGTAVGT